MLRAVVSHHEPVFLFHGEHIVPLALERERPWTPKSSALMIEMKHSMRRGTM